MPLAVIRYVADHHPRARGEPTPGSTEMDVAEDLKSAAAEEDRPRCANTGYRGHPRGEAACPEDTGGFFRMAAELEESSKIPLRFTRELSARDVWFLERLHELYRDGTTLIGDTLT